MSHSLSFGLRDTNFLGNLRIMLSGPEKFVLFLCPGHDYFPCTRLKRGFLALADLEAFLEADARIAPADFLEYPAF